MPYITDEEGNTYSTHSEHGAALARNRKKAREEKHETMMLDPGYAKSYHQQRNIDIALGTLCLIVIMILLMVLINGLYKLFEQLEKES